MAPLPGFVLDRHGCLISPPDRVVLEPNRRRIARSLRVPKSHIAVHPVPASCIGAPAEEHPDLSPMALLLDPHALPTLFGFDIPPNSTRVRHPPQVRPQKSVSANYF